MTPEAFRDAIAKGLGRTTLALQQDDPAMYSKAILDACVHNLQHDRQCEEDREPYVMDLVELAGLRPHALDAILSALPQSEEGWDRDWMIDLLGNFARGGDKRARETLLAWAEDGDERAQNRLAETDAVGLEWVAENVLPSLAEDDLWRVSRWLPDEGEDAAPPNGASGRCMRITSAEWSQTGGRG